MHYASLACMTRHHSIRRFVITAITIRGGGCPQALANEKVAIHIVSIVNWAQKLKKTDAK